MHLWSCYSGLLPLQMNWSTVPCLIQAVNSGWRSKGFRGSKPLPLTWTPYTKGSLIETKLSGGKITWHPMPNCSWCSWADTKRGWHDPCNRKNHRNHRCTNRPDPGMTDTSCHRHPQYPNVDPLVCPTDKFPDFFKTLIPRKMNDETKSKKNKAVHNFGHNAPSWSGGYNSQLPKSSLPLQRHSPC